jgi:hypothetical protein
MSKRTAKSQASSARAATGAFGSSAFGSSSQAFGVASSQLSYVSAISDPNVVVYFRNLSKRDSTTKAKALEDIQAYLSKEQAEEGLLEAWVRPVPACTYSAHSNEKCFAGQNLPPHLD